MVKRRDTAFIEGEEMEPAAQAVEKNGGKDRVCMERNTEFR